jgi:predicted unusual protein kinase regulating ubiquinone biosynthesis (AarF/ABC1/UbiB family)
MGFVARDTNVDVADRVIDYFQRRFLDDVVVDSWKLDDLQVDMRTKLEAMADLRRMDISFRQLTSTFQVPKDWVLLERTLILLLGLCTHLDRTMNPMSVIRPYLEEFVLGKDRDWSGLLRSSLKDVALAAATIPEALNRLLARANRGDLEVRTPDVRLAANLVYAAMRQLIFALFASSASLLAYFAHGRGQVGLMRAALTVASVSFVMLLVSMARTRSR